jgi:hypothetical protein
MRALVVFRYLSFDNVTVGPGATVSVFADPQPGTAPGRRLVDMPEDAIVAALLGDPRLKEPLLIELGLGPGTLHALKVRRPFVFDSREKPGDIDALLAEQSAPQAAIALETKRIKIRPTKNADGQRLNNIVASCTDVEQVNALAQLGLSRTYLALLLVVEDTARTQISVPLRGMTLPIVERVVDLSVAAPLDEGVGLCLIEMVQPTSRDFTQCGSVGVAVLRKPRPREQTGYLTNTVQRYFSDGGIQPNRT